MTHAQSDWQSLCYSEALGRSKPKSCVLLQPNQGTEDELGKEQKTEKDYRAYQRKLSLHVYMYTYYNEECL